MKAAKVLMTSDSKAKRTRPAGDVGNLVNGRKNPLHDSIICVLIGMMWLPPAVVAEEGNASMLSFNGFGTIGVVHSTEERADFTSSAFKPNGAGYSHNWSVDVDSRIGAQLSADFTPQLSAVLQVIAEQGFDNTYSPKVEWANIRYQFTPDLGVRLGRIELPVFLVSDVRKVGYANHWVRPPIEVYGVAPLTNNDGVDASYSMHFGDVINTLRGAYGPRYKLSFPGAGIDTRNLGGIFDSAEYGAALFHASYLQAKATQRPPNPLFGAFRQFGPPGIAVAEEYELANSGVSVVTVGASYEPGGWFAMSEWTRISSHSFLDVSTAWYVSGGYGIGKVTPYITWSQITASTVSDPGLAAEDFPAAFAGTVLALDAGLNTLLRATGHIQRTQSAGVRWDLAKNIDLKLQFDRTDIGANSTGTLINTQPGFHLGSNFNTFSAAVDCVF
jgi:hypothetical protein